MYRFETKDNLELITFYSPKIIALLNCFDSFDFHGESLVVETKNVIFESFEYVGF